MPLTHKEFRRSHFKPVSVSEIEAGGPEGTICGVIREVYLKSQSDDVKELIRLAMAMAKHMGKRLNEYKREEASG